LNGFLYVTNEMDHYISKLLYILRVITTL
jgi:hypothetical protein